MTDERILALDYGSVRVGVAISDPLQLIATALDTLKQDEHLLARLAALVEKHGVVRVVVGHPVTLSGRKSRKTIEVEEFARELETMLGRPVILWDERFTTSMAQQRLRELEVKRKRRRAQSGNVDAMAAVVILQSYLDSAKR